MYARSLIAKRTNNLLVDTRAYFTAATCAISLLKILSRVSILYSYSYKIKVKNTPPQFLSNNNLYTNDSQKKLRPAPFNTKGPVARAPKTNKDFNIETKAIILWDQKDNSSFRLQKGKLTNKIREGINITNYHKSVIIGLLLSDGYIQRRKDWNPRISLHQSIKNFDYIWLVFNSLSVYCSSYPYVKKTIKRRKLFFSLEFFSRQLKSFNEIYNIFYFKDSKIKNITASGTELFHYLDYVALAHWIQGDGAKRNKGIILCTDCFSVKEVVLLMNILLIKFDIISRIHFDNNRPRIYINKAELNKIKPLIRPYFVHRFLYKITY